MRRFVLSFATVLSIAAFSACSGGGPVLSFRDDQTPDHAIVTVAGPSNLARVLPGAGLALSAIQVNRSGAVLSGNNYRWSAALTTGGSYPVDALGNTKPCASVLQTIGAVTTPYTADFGIYIAIDPVNEANIIFFPPTILQPPPATTLTTNYPYCVTVTAQPGTILGSGIQTTFNPVGSPGSITVAVFDPLHPLP
jgi:hypothetical protein